MKKTVQISEPDARVEPEVSSDPAPSNRLATAALAFKNAAIARQIVTARLEEIRLREREAERELADADIEVGQLKQALAKAALE